VKINVLIYAYFCYDTLMRFHGSSMEARFRFRLIALAVFMTFFLTGLSLASSKQSLTLGVLAYRPDTEVREKYQPLADYLSRQLSPRTVNIEVLNYAEFSEALEHGKLDFVLTNPGHYIFLKHRYGLSGVLATLVENEHGLKLDNFGGVIFTRSNRTDINRLIDLKQKKIASVGANSLGGYQAQSFELLRAGVRLPHDCEMLFTEMPHDAAVLAVLQGRADAGFVRTGVLESMAREGRLDVADIKIVNRSADSSFPLIVSTRLYPEWPFVVVPRGDNEIPRRVAAALLSLKHGSEVPRRGGYWGFTISADYAPVQDLLLALRLPPYDSSPPFTARDVWQRYRVHLLTLVLAITISGALTVKIILINRRLTVERKRAEDNERYYRTLFEAGNDGLVIVDFNGRFLDINSAAHSQLGYTREEMLLTNMEQLNDAAFKPLVRERFDKLCAEGHLIYETAHVRKDGSVMPVEVNAKVISYGKQQAVLAAVRDQTERKKIELERERLIAELQQALAEIKTLRGILPICSICKKIRDDRGSWRKLETYISEHTDADFTHGLCEECARKHYSKYLNRDGEKPA
jgi:PAS domain S-box-containing protein